MRTRKERLLLGVASAAVVALAGCGSSQSTTPGAVGSSLKGLATNSAVAKAKNEITGCVNKTGVSKLLSKSGRTEVISCVQNLVPPAKRETLRKCVTSAATSDKIWTSDGRSKFLNTDGPKCVNDALA